MVIYCVLSCGSYKLSEELKKAFTEAQDGSKRYLIVRIKAETLELAGDHAATSSAEDDFGTIVDKLAEHEPSFVLFRRDLPEDSEERAWILIS